MTTARLRVTRTQILAFRRRVGALDQRLPAGRPSLQRAAWAAGLQDSMPRAALFSIHARVEDAGPSAWEDSSLVQAWGPSYHVYVVAARDLAVFTLGRLPDGGKTRRATEDLAARLHVFLGGAQMRYDEAGHALGVDGDTLRYAALTGRLAIRWEGARRPTVWIVPPPDIAPSEAALELARRYLHVFGPTRPEALAKWAGIGGGKAVAVFDDLGAELIPVLTPFGDPGFLLATNPPSASLQRPRPLSDSYRAAMPTAWGSRARTVRSWCRTLANGGLWTPRVWPGTLLVAGKVVGTWRRAHRTVTIQTWQRLSRTVREAVLVEAESLPLPDTGGRIVVHWN